MSRFSKILSGSYLHFSPFAGESGVSRELQLPTLAGLILELVKDTLLVQDSTGDRAAAIPSLSPLLHTRSFAFIMVTYLFRSPLY